MVVGLIALALAFEPVPDPMARLGFMSGYWLDCTGAREASEAWSDPRIGLMAGHAVTVRGGRSGYELSYIRADDQGRPVYHAQPEGYDRVAFPAIEVGDNRVVFENLANDFPHRIVYERVGDVLSARISGADDDPERSAQWRYNLVPLNSRCPVPAPGVP